MFRDLFRNRLFIGILVLLICAAMSIYFLQTDTPKAPIKIYKPVEPIAKQPPKVGDTSQGGHWHGDEWHADPHDAPPTSALREPDLQIETPVVSETETSISSPIPSGITPDWASMSPDELVTAIEAIADSRLFAPEGYDYKENADGTVMLDENGYPVVHKRGEPFFGVRWVQGYRPTPEQHAEYKALLERYKQAGLAGSPEEDRLGEQLLEMRRTYVGEVPLVGWSWSVPGDTDMEAFHRRASERAREIEHEAYRKAGLGYMLD